MKKSNLILTALLAIGTLAIANSSAYAVLLLGNPFVPAGANFQIFALQGIDSSAPTGKSGFSPQVNRDFEFPDAIGVSYDAGGGKLTNFGLGLYFNSQQQVQSTGLNIRYGMPVNASSVNVTVEDFDIKVGAAFFNPQKVEPGLLILGANNAVIANALPKDIFPNLVPNTTAGKARGDVWDINLGSILNTLNISDTTISGFILYADSAAGERPNSDPYLLVSVGNGICVPEASNYIVGLAGVVFGGLFQIRQLQLKRKAAAAKI